MCVRAHARVCKYFVFSPFFQMIHFPDYLKNIVWRDNPSFGGLVSPFAFMNIILPLYDLIFSFEICAFLLFMFHPHLYSWLCVSVVY